MMQIDTQRCIASGEITGIPYRVMWGNLHFYV